MWVSIQLELSQCAWELCGLFWAPLISQVQAVMASVIHTWVCLAALQSLSLKLRFASGHGIQQLLGTAPTPSSASASGVLHPGEVVFVSEGGWLSLGVFLCFEHCQLR